MDVPAKAVILVGSIWERNYPIVMAMEVITITPSTQHRAHSRILYNRCSVTIQISVHSVSSPAHAPEWFPKDKGEEERHREYEELHVCDHPQGQHWCRWKRCVEGWAVLVGW